MKKNIIRFYWRTIALLLLPFIGMSLHAASVSFRVEAPSQVIEGNKFSITYVLENSPEYPQNIEIKEIPNCRFLFGPAIMQSSSDITTNGKRRHSSSVRYTYTYRAEKQGSVKISAANAIVGGKYCRRIGRRQTHRAIARNLCKFMTLTPRLPISR